MGLKKDLHEILKSMEGRVLTCDQLEIICKRQGRKLSNGERRLRPSDSPQVESIRNGKGYIVGYRWLGEPLKVEEPPLSYPSQLKLGSRF